MTLQNPCDFTFSLCLEGPDFKCVIGPAHFIPPASPQRTRGECGLTMTFLNIPQHRAITRCDSSVCACGCKSEADDGVFLCYSAQYFLSLSLTTSSPTQQV